MKKILISILILLTIETYSQVAVTNPIDLPQGYSLSLLNAKGTSGINNNVSNINFINPAALGEFNQITTGVSYEYQTNIKEAWIADIGYKRFSNLPPQSFGLIIPVKDFKIGFSAGQIYKSNMDIGEIMVTTIDQPDGTGETISSEFKTNVYSYSLSASYSVKNLWLDDEFGMGIRFSYNNLKYFESFSNLSIDESAKAFGSVLGLTYKFNLDENENICFGLSYSTEISFSQNYTLGEDNTLYTDTSRNISYYAVSQNLLLKGNIPSHLNFDFNINTIPQIELTGSIKDIFWSQINSNVKDQFEISGSIIYKLNYIFKPSIGFYLTDYNLKQDLFGLNKEMNAFYITAGLQININPINIDLALADSHLLSGEFRKQTIIKAGIGVGL